jgi:hypothetical protein
MATYSRGREVHGILSVAKGGTGWSTITSGTLLYGSGGSALATTSAGTAGNVLALLNGIPTWTATTTFSSPLSYSAGAVSLGTVGVANGGTGTASFSQGWIYSAGGTNTLAASTSPTVNYIVATSTTVASVFGGGLVDQANKNCTGTTKAVITDANGLLGCGTLTLSDARLKTNITPLDAAAGLSLIDSLVPVAYNWAAPGVYGGTTQRQYGFIAQAALAVAPDLVGTTTPTALTPDQTYFFNYFGLIAPIVKAIQELSAKISDTAHLVLGSLTVHDTMCINSTCLTEDDLKTFLAQKGQNNGTDPAAPSAIDTPAPDMDESVDPAPVPEPEPTDTDVQTES